MEKRVDHYMADLVTAVRRNEQGSGEAWTALRNAISDIAEEAYDLGMRANLPGGDDMTIARLLEREGL